ncbi:hypothetical protein, partial [Actinomadura sp. 7K507]|uniref:hypothetical protein n=1 Tax=Actinomadura sp. 7K507 TaxID=2530365 RepID=UPI00104EA3B4
MTRGISLGGAPSARWTLDHEGHRLEVGTGRAGWSRVVRLYVDGELAEEATAVRKATLPYGEMTVAVAFGRLGLLDGQAARCELVPPGSCGTSCGGDGGKDAQ